jgi:signal transduction histidine kinase
MEILKGYEEEVKAQGLESRFQRVNELKDELDYNFLLEEIKQLLEGITEGAERTAEIVRGLRNFSRLDEDVLKLANVNQGIESTLLLLRSELKDRIEIVKDMPDMPDIMCYPGKLNGVYMNILTNAMQAINGPGKIFITTRHHGDHVKISIRDTGPGMPEEVQKRIFEPFFTTKDVGFGTGLGLSITYGAIEQHKGKITVKSKMGEGTEFVIVLPLAKQNVNKKTF